jgi:hypothetical protein
MPKRIGKAGKGKVLPLRKERDTTDMVRDVMRRIDELADTPIPARAVPKAPEKGPAEVPTPVHPMEREKDPAAVALGRRGGLKGGKARMGALTPEQRRRLAKKAARARWGKKA